MFIVDGIIILSLMDLKEWNGAGLFCRKTELIVGIVPDFMILGHRRHIFALTNSVFLTIELQN
jgi:hypothetical protein